jgi:CRP-like cAMP-binding protein
MSSLPIKENSYLFARGEELPSSSDSLWLIVSGVVKSYTFDEEGEIIPIGYWGEEDAVGQAISGVEPYFMECLTEVKAFMISPYQLQQLPAVMLKHTRNIEQLMCLLRYQSVEKRFLSVLKWLADRFGSRVEQGRLINLELTHNELAQLIGAARVTVTKLINHLEREGIILRRKKFIVLIENHVRELVPLRGSNQFKVQSSKFKTQNF